MQDLLCCDAVLPVDGVADAGGEDLEGPQGRPPERLLGGQVPSHHRRFVRPFGGW